MKEKEKKGDFKIPEDALEKIKSQSELDDFFSDLYKQAVEGMLNGKNGKVDPLPPIESDPLPPGLFDPLSFYHPQQRTFLC